MCTDQIVFWLESHVYETLSAALEAQGTTIAQESQSFVHYLYTLLVPLEQRIKFEEAAEQERRAADAEYDARCRFAVCRITEQSQTQCICYETTNSSNFFYTLALRLRIHLRESNGQPFADSCRTLQNLKTINEEQYHEMADQLIAGSIKIEEAIDINFDRGEFALANARTGWTRYRQKDVSTAVFYTKRKGFGKSQETSNYFFSKLAGKEIQPDNM